MDAIRHFAGYGLETAKWVVILFFMSQNLFSVLLLVLSAFGVFQFVRASRHEILSVLSLSEILPPISVLVPAYNESKTIVDSVHSILSLNYPRFEVVVINDGSKDSTLDMMKEHFQLYPIIPLYDETIETKPVRSLYRSKKYSNLLMIDKENGGKSDSLNSGINLSSSPLICAVDADTVVDEHALLHMVRPYLLDPGRVAGVGGTIRVANGCVVEGGRMAEIGLSKSWFVRVQVIEYIRAFLFGRLGWNSLGGPLIISGAFGLFRKDLVVRAGGYRTDTVGEDMDLALSLHELDGPRDSRYAIVFVPDTVCWTQVPEDFKTLRRQRERWQRGLSESLTHHRRMMFSPKYGFTGVVGIPFAFFGEMLSPLMETLGYISIAVGYAIGRVDLQFTFLFFLLAWGFGIVLSDAAILLEEVSYHRYSFSQMVSLFVATVLEGIGYRQINLWWRLSGLIQFLTGKKGWGGMQRQVFSPVAGGPSGT